MSDTEEKRIKKFKEEADRLLSLLYEITDERLVSKRKETLSIADKQLMATALTLHGALKMFITAYYLEE